VNSITLKSIILICLILFSIYEKSLSGSFTTVSFTKAAGPSGSSATGRSLQNGSIEISIKRADELLARLPKNDPWLDKPDGSTLAWGESGIMQSLVYLYEASGDRKYLEQLAFRGDRLLSHRDDRRGVKDGSGKSRPAWSMGLKYVVAEGYFSGENGVPVIKILSTPSAYNNSTEVELIHSKDIRNRFSLRVTNSYYKRNEVFENLSLDRSDDRFIEKIVNDPMSPYSARAGNYTDKSNLIRVTVTGTRMPVERKITLKPIPLAFMNYTGIIYDPMLQFAEIVRADPGLKALDPVADRFIRAAMESYADASARLWRNGPGEGEGYYLTCEKGESFPADNVGAPFNFQGRHVCAQLALYRLTGEREYLERSQKICRFFKNRLKYIASTDLYIWNYWFEPMTTKGWKPEDKLSQNVGYFEGKENVEDISHGVLDIAMVMAAWRSGIVFSTADVNRFANTLLVNVLNSSRTEVRRRVDGGPEHPAYFNALNGWLVLAEAEQEVYRAIRSTYLNKKEESLIFCAHLLKWERKLR
jgi:hypothetical protein